MKYHPINFKEYLGHSKIVYLHQRVGLQSQSNFYRQQNQQQMIASHKLRTHFPTPGYPTAKKETTTYQDQNNYSFSSKQPNKQLSIAQTFKQNSTSFIKSHKETSFTLITKEENIKSIDERIQAIMKKHSTQKDYLQTCKVAPIQSTQNHHHTLSMQDTKMHQRARAEDYQSKKWGNKNHSQMPQYRQSQICNKRNYASANKETKYSAHKDTNNDNLDQKIKFLNERILKAEQQKKKLNIKFTPFQWQNNPSAEVKLAKQAVFVDGRSRKSSIIREPILAFQSITAQPIEMKEQPLGRIKRQKSTNEVKPKFKESVNTYKVRPNQKDLYVVSAQRAKQHLGQFVEALVQQIKLDEMFRNLKIWFTFCNQKGKWDLVKQKLASKKRTLTLEELRENFQSSVEQHNPFFKWDAMDFNSGLQKLVQAFLKSDKHWKTAILNKWSKPVLQQGGMKRKVQFDSKSETIAEQDLVRFINLQKATYFRNRDVYMIYRRLCGKGKILSYQQLSEAISRDQQ